jgi:hypothetical protein
VRGGRQDGRREHASVPVDIRLAEKLFGLPRGITSLLSGALGTAVLLPHGGIAAVERKELLMGASLHHGTRVEDDDLVGMGDGR